MKKIFSKKQRGIELDLRFSDVFLSITLSFLISISSFSQSVGINASGTPPDASAGLDVDFNDKGLLLPRVTTAQRDVISNPAPSLMIFNMDTECFEAWSSNASSWVSFGCIGCDLPILPIASAGTNVSTTDFDASWSTSAGAVNYYLDVATDLTFTSFVSGFNNLDVGNVTSYNITGLTCETDYYYRVRSENICGTTESSNEITVATEPCCGSPTVTFTYKGSTVTYGVVSGENGTCWLDRNLGATQVATSSADADAYGDLFQWGRGTDEHQERDSETTTTRSDIDTPVHSSFIKAVYSPHDWRIGQNSDLWQGVNGINNPCPDGWRIPTKIELENKQESWSSQSAAGAFASPLKLPVAGFREFRQGNLNNVWNAGRYWSSTVSADNQRAWSLGFDFMIRGLENARAYGYSVRCIKD